MIDTVFVDLDGVLADFVGGICQAHGRDNPYQHTTARGHWTIQRLLEIPEEEFWSVVDYNFWVGLQPTWDGYLILESAETTVGKDNTYLLTNAGAGIPGNMAGKTAWVQKHLPDYSERLFTGIDKHRLASPNKALIDDSDRECHAWETAGGKPVLVPRYWNQDWAYVDHSVDFVRLHLRVAAGREQSRGTPIWELERYGASPTAIGLARSKFGVNTVEALLSVRLSVMEKTPRVRGHIDNLLLAEMRFLHQRPTMSIEEVAGVDRDLQYKIWKGKQSRGDKQRRGRLVGA